MYFYFSTFPQTKSKIDCYKSESSQFRLYELILSSVFLIHYKIREASNKNSMYVIITYFISISKTNDNNKEPEQPIDMRMKKDNKAKA